VDPITQAALGAAAGHAVFHRQLGTRAIAIGAVAGAFPDVDAFWGLFEGPFGRLVSHRGITHSLFFGPVVGSIAGWLWWRRERGRAQALDDVVDVRAWIGLFIVALMSHPLLDWCTTFGTQLLAPISRARFALNSIPIVDPVYSGVLALGLLLGWLMRSRPSAGWFPGIAVLVSTGYLFLGLWINAIAEREADRQLAGAGVDAAEIHAFPTLLQLPHRRIVALTDDEVRVGFVSMWRPCRIEWGVAPRYRDARIDEILATPEGRIYAWFSNGLLAADIVAEDGGHRVRLVDLRYGYVPDPLRSLWGIDTRFDSAGRMLGPPERFTDRPEVSGKRIAMLFADAFPSSCPASG
jgi:inner membrane protein